MRLPNTLSAIAVTAVTACATPSPATGPSPMALPAASDSEYVAFERGGNSSISGQAFLTTRGGDVKVAAGRTVTLDPATPYARAWYDRYGRILGRFAEMPPDPRFARARRTTVADAEGRFRFTGLPPGPYILRTTVTWEIPAQYAALQGGVVSEIVTVPEAGNTEVVLSTVSGPSVGVAAAVDILTPEQIAGRAFKVRQQVTGMSCRRSVGVDPPATEARARADLAEKAATLGADAVTNVVCRQGGVSLRKNCIGFFECVGDAISWS